MAKQSKPYRPKDINQLAKYLVDLSTGIIEEKEAKSKKVRNIPVDKNKDNKS